MNEKISIDEIQKELHRIIEAPTNRQMLNGIWWLRNQIAGDYYREKRTQEIQKIVIKAMNNFEEEIQAGPMPNHYLKAFRRHTDKCRDEIDNIRIKEE